MTQSLLFDPSASGTEAPVYDKLFSVNLEGVCAIDGSDDVACAMIGLAWDHGTVVSAAPVAFGDEATLSLPHIGLQKGAVVRVFDGGFDVRLDCTPHTRLATYLAWLMGLTDSVASEELGVDRIVPVRKLVALDSPGEPSSLARIVDLSRSSVAFTTSRRLSIGDRIRLGRQSGRVARLFEGGAAARFEEPIAVDRFDAMIDLAA